MGVRAYGRETLASLPIDVDKNWNDRSISNVNSLQANEHITITARGANRNLHPSLNRYDSETDGWYVSKDNNDIERKFWKDDFSVDSSSQYTVNGTVTGWGTGTLSIPASGKIITANSVASGNNYGRYSVTFTGELAVSKYIIMSLTPTNSVTCVCMQDLTTGTYRVYMRDWVAPLTFIPGISTLIPLDTTNHTFSLDYNESGFSIYFDGVEIIPKTSAGSRTLSGVIGVWVDGGTTTDILELKYLPSISYSDDFASDTVSGANGRYQAVTGTVAYDDANKRMGLNTAAARLKSYTFRQGSIKTTVTMPPSDGNRIQVRLSEDGTLLAGNSAAVHVYNGAGTYEYRLYVNNVQQGASVVSTCTSVQLADILIERDTDHGVWYIYCWNASTESQPVTPTFKLFTSGYQEVYWGAVTSGLVYVTDISIRAESIVGRTNVPVEEDFWFRDEFSENSLGRYLGTKSGLTVSGGKLVPTTTSQNLKLPSTLKYVESKFDFRIDTTFYLTETSRASLIFGVQTDFTGAAITSGYAVTVAASVSSTVIGLYKDAYTTLETSALGYALTVDTDYEIKVVHSAGNIKVYLDDVLVIDFDDATYTSGYAGLYIHSSGNSSSANIRIDNLQISGTRVYNKPIHRGAMLETWNDGTQEVVGTTFVDDCQWDRSAEWTSVGTPILDTVNGVIKCDADSESVFTKDSYLDGYYACRFTTLAANERIALVFATDTNNTSTNSGTKYLLYYSSSGGDFRLFRLNGGTPTSIQTYAVALSAGTYDITVLKSGSSIIVTLNGISIMNATDVAPLSVGGRAGFGISGVVSTGANLSNIQIIAASPDATNGIAACIPPIGGGARYNEQEKVYKQLVNAAKFGEYKTTALAKTTNADAEAIEMYFKNTTDTTNIATDDTDTLAISLTDTNYSMLTKDLQLLHRDRADTIEVAVRASSAATPASPACYVTDLMILPKTEG